MSWEKEGFEIKVGDGRPEKVTFDLRTEGEGRSHVALGKNIPDGGATDSKAEAETCLISPGRVRYRGREEGRR